MEFNKEITDIICRVKEANKAYRIGEPIMTDTEYDNLVDFLESELGDSFKSIRESLTEESGKVRHPFKMGSLAKIKAFDESASVKDWILNHIPENGDKSEGIFVSSKIDGCSARLSYVNGRLVSASTRGTGDFGVDILHKVSLFVPTKIAHTFTGNIRGEITLTKETFEALSNFTGKAYKNLRNATAGLINAKDASNEEISFLRFFPYEIMGATGMTKSAQYKRLKELGFTTALFKEFTDIYNDAFTSGATYDEALLSIYNEFAEKAPFDMDGLVVSDLNDTDVFEDEFTPSRTVAVKFNQMTGTTTLIGVAWNTSKAGKLCPTGIVDMVGIGGSDVTAVTLNNIEYIKELGLRNGCSVTVLKSGDVIPKIVGVSHPNPSIETDIEYPKFCPSCGKPLDYTVDKLFPMCVNAECDGILFNKIIHFLEQLDIKHVKMKMLKKFNIRHISDLINLKPDDGAVKEKFVRDIYNKMFGADKETLLTAFDYNGVSSLIIEKMLAHYGYDTLLNSTEEELKKSMPYGVGEKFIEKFVNGWNAARNDYTSIISDDRYHGQNTPSKKTVVVSGVLNGKGFVVTGDLKTMSRDEFKKMVVSNGGVYQSGISKRTSYLVTNDSSTGTMKIKKAKDLGVEIIDEQRFLNMVQHGNSSASNSNFSIF